MHNIDLSVHNYTWGRSRDKHIPFSQPVMTIGKEECWPCTLNKKIRDCKKFSTSLCHTSLEEASSGKCWSSLVYILSSNPALPPHAIVIQPTNNTKTSVSIHDLQVLAIDQLLQNSEQMRDFIWFHKPTVSEKIRLLENWRLFKGSKSVAWFHSWKADLCKLRLCIPHTDCLSECTYNNTCNGNSAP